MFYLVSSFCGEFYIVKFNTEIEAWTAMRDDFIDFAGQHHDLPEFKFGVEDGDSYEWEIGKSFAWANDNHGDQCNWQIFKDSDIPNG